MKREGDFWIPDGDRHFVSSARSGEYQRSLITLSLPHVKDFGLAVDIGAHVGLLTAPLLKSFETVWAFEPETENFACLKKNAPEAIAHNVAIGREFGRTGLKNPDPKNSGAWELCDGDDACIAPLDAFWLKPGLIKVDVQGGLLEVLKGARETLNHKPVLILEVVLRGQRDEEAVDFVKALGARVLKSVGRKDIIMGWE